MQLHAYLHFCKVIEILGVRWLGTKLVQIPSSKKTTASSGVAIGIGRAPLRSDMSGTNMVLWPVTCLARPGLRMPLTASDES